MVGNGGVVPPKQRRTQANVERILAAVEQLIERREFADVSVLEICEVAEVSTSSFYARFSSKEALHSAMFERVIDSARRELEDVVTEMLREPLEPVVVIRTVLSHVVQFVRRHASLLRSIERDPVLVERYWLLTSDTSDELAVVLETLYGVDDPAFRRRLQLGVRVCGSTVLRAVGAPVQFGDRLGLTDAELVDELGDMLAAYLDVAASRSR